MEEAQKERIAFIKDCLNIMNEGNFEMLKMDKYKIKDLAERLQKENTTELKNKMLFMWIKQEVISLKEYNELVKLILPVVAVELPKSNAQLFEDWLLANSTKKGLGIYIYKNKEYSVWQMIKKYHKELKSDGN